MYRLFDVFISHISKVSQHSIKSRRPKTFFEQNVETRKARTAMRKEERQKDRVIEIMMEMMEFPFLRKNDINILASYRAGTRSIQLYLIKYFQVRQLSLSPDIIKPCNKYVFLLYNFPFISLFACKHEQSVLFLNCLLCNKSLE